MMTIKMMKGDGLADTHPNASFSLIQIGTKDLVSFFKESAPNGDFNEARPQTLRIDRDDGSTQQFTLAGNVYILSESGKTIASHGS